MSTSNLHSATAGPSVPSGQTPRAKEKSKFTAATSYKETFTSQQFTPMMQDAQARGKLRRPTEGGGNSSDSSMEWNDDDRFNAFGFDNYTRTQQRRGAATILDSPELIMMHALARGDSIPNTRHYFTKMLCGYLDPSEVYKEPNAPPPSAEKKHKKQRLMQRGRLERPGSPMDVD